MLLKRHRIPKREPIHGDRAFWHWTDLAIGSIADIYSKKYHICSSDEFTRKYLASEGINLDDNVPGKSQCFKNRKESLILHFMKIFEFWRENSNIAKSYKMRFFSVTLKHCETFSVTFMSPMITILSCSI